MSTFDSDKYKEGQRQGWNNVAGGWHKWWKTTENAGENISKRMIELADIKQGFRVLDVATGLGEPAITAAQHVGNRGTVLAVDLSIQMLSFAKQRAISLGLQNVIEFQEGDLKTIDLPNLTFDAALCRFGLMFFPDPKVGLSKIHKSLVDGGRFSAVVWASPDKVPFISVPLDTLLKEMKNPVFPTNTPGPFSLSDENLLKDSYINAGFKDIVIERQDMIFNFDSAEAFTNFVYETASPVQVFLSNQSQERKKEILRAITEAVTRYAEKDSGSISFKNEAICIAGKT